MALTPIAIKELLEDGTTEKDIQPQNRVACLCLAGGNLVPSVGLL